MIRAKFKCTKVEQVGDDEVVKLDAVTSGSAENAEWSKYTPSGQLGMTISNPAAQGRFEAGAEYFLDFTPAAAE